MLKSASHLTRLRRLLVALAPLALVVWSVAPCVAAADEAQLRHTIEQLRERYKLPGLSVAVAHNGKIVWAEGFGALSTKSDRPVITQTRFQAASISKPVAALAALELVEQGRLQLDEPVNARLVSWKIPENDQTQQAAVTLRWLLCHGAGTTVHGFPGYGVSEKWPSLVEILDGSGGANTEAIRVNRAPGTAFRYSGGGYCILQQLIMDVTGKPFDEAMQELALGPLGMKDSSYAQPLPEKEAADAAHGHRADGEEIQGAWRVHPEQAAAGLWTTPSDLARFLIAIHKAYRGEPGSVLSRPLAEEMLKPQVGPNIGLGLFLSSGGAVFEHGGSNLGFRSLAVACRDSGDACVAMTNSDRGGRPLGLIVEAVKKEYGWPVGK